MDKLRDTFNFFIVPLEVLKDDTLTIHEKMVYMVLRSFVNPHHDTVWPSYNLIAKLGSMSRRKAIDVVESLIQKGYIIKDHKFEYRNNKVMNDNNRYRLTLPRLEHTLVHDMHQPSAQDAPTLVHDMHQPSAQDAPELYQSTKYKKQKDDDRGIIIESVFDKYKDKITRRKFDVVVKRVMKYPCSNFESFLTKAVVQEIAKPPIFNGTTEKAKSKRPNLPVVSSKKGSKTEITDDQRQEMLELIKRLKD